MNFLASPEIVTAMAFAGRLSFNPTTDSITDADGKPFKFDPPSGVQLPPKGFAPGDLAYAPKPRPTPQPDTNVAISPESTRLELLVPFSKEFPNSRGMELPPLKCLMRVRGKCTTDHISAAGPWLKFKGHLSNIAENTLITAVNDEGGEVNAAFDHDHSSTEPAQDTIPAVVKRFKSRSQPWALVVDENYGEGSAREHAAMQPRFLGCLLIIARSFARIHETNLKKQGILPLWFANKADYSLISAGDVIETEGLAKLLEGDENAQIRLLVTKRDGSKVQIETRHTMSADQVKWVKAGSALNYIREQKTRIS
ncbi:aconitate hydratase [Tulasnella sp. 403]|nr:aconitate hydratase [Tulasnella sp. 403]